MEQDEEVEKQGGEILSSASNVAVSWKRGRNLNERLKIMLLYWIEFFVA